MLISTLLIFFSADLLYERPAGIPNRADMVPGLFFTEPWILSKIFGFQFSSIEGAFWSLYVEVKFYILFGMFYFFAKHRAVMLLTALFLTGWFFKTLIYLGLMDPTAFFYKTLFKLLSLQHFGWFCIGALLYLQSTEGGKKYISGAIALLPFALSMTGGKNAGTFIFGSLLVLLFYFSLTIPILKKILGHQSLRFWGFISYPLYLTHENAMVSLTIKTHDAFKWIPDMLSPAPGLITIVLLAYVIARYGEPAVKHNLIFIQKYLNYKSN